jgi:hypothetical protein
MKKYIYEITCLVELMPLIEIEFTSYEEAENYANENNITNYIITWCEAITI